MAWSHATGTLKKGYDWQAATLREPTPFTHLGRPYPDPLLERLRVHMAVEAAPSSLSPLERRLAAYMAPTLKLAPALQLGYGAQARGTGGT